MKTHWLDEALAMGKQLNLTGHQNRPRISAETILKMVNYKNSTLGIRRSLHEESQIAEESTVN